MVGPIPDIGAADGELVDFDWRFGGELRLCGSEGGGPHPQSILLRVVPKCLWADSQEPTLRRTRIPCPSQVTAASSDVDAGAGQSFVHLRLKLQEALTGTVRFETIGTSDYTQASPARSSCRRNTHTHRSLALPSVTPIELSLHQFYGLLSELERARNQLEDML